jgi:hypothetical protein
MARERKNDERRGDDKEGYESGFAHDRYQGLICQVIGELPANAIKRDKHHEEKYPTPEPQEALLTLAPGESV